MCEEETFDTKQRSTKRWINNRRYQRKETEKRIKPIIKPTPVEIDEDLVGIDLRRIRTLAELQS